MRWRPESGRPPERILVIQLRRIGDAVLVTPTLDALLAAFPESRIHLLTTEPIPELFRGDPRVQAVWPRPPRSGLWRLSEALRREAFDLCLDFQSLPLTAAIARRSGATTVGFARRYRTRAYHLPVRLDEHRNTDYAADHKLDLLRALGLQPELTQPRLIPPPPDETLWNKAGSRGRLVLVPVSLRAHKRWPLSSFAETASRIHRETAVFTIVAGGPGESGSVNQAAHLLEDTPHQTRVCTNLEEFGALIAGAHLFLGNDNGPRHMAIALGVPTLAYFGTQNPTHWTPPGSTRHRVLWDSARAEGRNIREDLHIVPDDPASAARAGVELMEIVSR